MKRNKTESSTAVEALPKLVEILSPLSPSEREKAISAVRILLADSVTSAGTHQELHVAADKQLSEGLAPKAAGWLRKNHISREQLDQIFSIEDNTFDVIATKMPGKSKRQQ